MTATRIDVRHVGSEGAADNWQFKAGGKKSSGQRDTPLRLVLRDKAGLTEGGGREGIAPAPPARPNTANTDGGNE